MKGKTMQSVYLLPGDNKDNPVIPARYTTTIQNTDGSPGAIQLCKPKPRLRLFGFYQNYTVPCPGNLLLRVAVTQAEDALYCSLQIWDDPGLESVPPALSHAQTGLGSPLFLLFTHSCDSPLECPLTASSTAAITSMPLNTLLSNPILTLLKSCSFHG